MKTLLTAVHYKIYLTALSILRRYVHARHTMLDYSSIVILTGAPRSGTTWLAETLSAATGYPIFWEPFTPTYDNQHVLNIPEFRRVYQSRKGNSQSLKRYLLRVFCGAVVNPTTVQKCSLFHVAFPKGWIIKCIHATMLVPWLNCVFPQLKPIIIVRHPCAVIASQMRWGWWEDWKRYTGEDLMRCYAPVINDIENFSVDLARLKTFEEILAAVWCFDYVLVLQHPNDKNLLLSYEELLTRGEKTLLTIIQHIDILKIGYRARKAVERLSVPSATRSDLLLSGKSPLLYWREVLSADQVRRIMGVVRGFGISLYDEGPEPDYSLLHTLNNNTAPK